MDQWQQRFRGNVLGLRIEPPRHHLQPEQLFRLPQRLWRLVANVDRHTVDNSNDLHTVDNSNDLHTIDNSNVDDSNVDDSALDDASNVWRFGGFW